MIAETDQTVNKANSTDQVKALLPYSPAAIRQALDLLERYGVPPSERLNWLYYHRQSLLASIEETNKKANR